MKRVVRLSVVLSLLSLFLLSINGYAAEGSSSDTTVVAGKGGLRKSHYYNDDGIFGMFNTKCDNADYAETVVEYEGSGSAYVTENPSAVDVGSRVTTLSWSCDSLMENHKATHYLFAEPEEGWYFKEWQISYEDKDSITSTANPHREDIVLPYATREEGDIYGHSDYEDPANPYTVKAKAVFKPILVNRVSPAEVDVAPVNTSVLSEDYAGKVVFSLTGADSWDDFETFSPAQDGNGTFTFDTKADFSKNTVTVNWTFHGDGTYGAGSSTRSRQNRATLTLTSKANSGSPLTQTCEIVADYPDVELSGNDVNIVTTSGSAATTGTAIVNVRYADDKNDFTSFPVSLSATSGSGGTWSIGTMTMSATDYTTGYSTVTIPYTFTPNSSTGTATASLTLAANAEAGDDALIINFSATVEAASANEAAIGGTQYATLASAFAAAKEEATVKLLKDISPVSTITISKTLTLDLNGYTITSSANDALEVTGGATVTMNSSRGSGKLVAEGSYAGRLSAVKVTNGHFVLAGGDVVARNSNGGAGSAVQAVGVYVGASTPDANKRPTTSAQMSDGKISVTRSSGSYAYGILCEEGGAVNLSGGTIVADAAVSHAYGVSVRGASPLKDMTIVATAPQNAYTLYVNDGATVVIDGGSYTATATGADAAALVSLGNTRITNGTFIARSASATYAADVQGGAMVVSAGSFDARATGNNASALNIAAGSATVHGGMFTAHASTSQAKAVNIAASSASLTTTGGTFSATVDRTGSTVADGYAYGLYAVAGSKAELKNSTIKSLTINGNYAYGAYALGELKAESVTVVADSKNAHAYGVHTAGGATIISSRLTATAGAANSRALQVNGSEASLTGATFLTALGIGNVYGAYISSGHLESTGAAITASGSSAVVAGVQVASSASATLGNNTISATGVSSACALRNGGSLTVSDGTASANGYALYAESTCTATDVVAGNFYGDAGSFALASGASGVVFRGGHYNTNTGMSSYLASSCSFYDILFGTADYSAGYRYSVGTESAPGIAVCRNVQTGVEYNTLADALQEAETDEVIVLTHDYTLPAGDYIVPDGVTLLIPYFEAQQAPVKNSIPLVVRNSPVSPDVPSPLYTLTFAQGANLTVKGNIEASGQLTSATGSLTNEHITGATCGTYGYIYMRENSNIILEGGSNFWCWGFVSGNGRVDVRSGARINEPFVLGWWKGGTALFQEVFSSGHLVEYKVFPFTDYYYQNIEVPVRYHPGALAFATGGINVEYAGLKMDARATVQLVGTMGKLNGDGPDNGLFLMNEGDTRADSWVEKHYLAERDSIVWTVNSGANISNLSLDLGISLGSTPIVLDTKIMNLPISNNMTITVNYGRVEIMQDIVFLPGSTMDIRKEATVFIAGESEEGADDGKSIYLYDAEEWEVANGGRYYILPKYSPSWGTVNPRLSMGYDETTPLPDAEMFVHGRFELPKDAHFYTTAGGANIHSTNEDAGMILFSEDAADDVDVLRQWTENPERYTAKDASAAKLRNADGTYAETLGTEAYQLWGYKNNRWIKMVLDGCSYEELDGEGQPTGVVNVYPSAFLEIEENENGDHAYHATDNPSHYIINTVSSIYEQTCVWWDAERVEEDGSVYMISKESSDLYGAYYRYDDEVECWMPIVNRIDWYITDGETEERLGYNNVAYNAVPKYSGKVYNEADELTMQAYPTMVGDATFDYFWDGWVTEGEDWENPDCRILSNDDMPIATEDVNYYAHFNKVMKQYSVKFLNEDGTLIEEKNVDAGTMPECSAAPTKESTDEYDYELVWTPVLEEVTAPASYRASFEAVTRKYTVTFANYNGDVLKRADVDYGTDLSVAANLDAVKPADPTRQNDGFFSYDFEGWSPAPSVVKGAVTYTAQYSVTDWTPEYEITFLNWDGSTVQTQYVRYGNSLTDPASSETPEREEDEAGTYAFSGWLPALAVTPTADATYTAQYTVTPKEYTILFKDYDGTVLLRSNVTGGTMPTPPSSPFRGATAQYEYSFTGWSPAVVSANADAVYSAQYSDELRTYRVRFLNWDGTVLKTIEDASYGSTPSYDGTPSKPAEGYTTYSFDYWYPSLAAVTGNRDYTATYRSYTRNMQVYERSVTAEMFGTICLPYAVEAGGIGDGIEVWDVIGYGSEDETMLRYESVSTMAAGRAYVFYSQTDEVRFTYEEIGAPAAAQEGYPLKGFIGDAADDTQYLSVDDYVLHAEGWMRVTGATTDWILSNRAYLRLGYLAPYVPLSPAAAARTRTARIFKSANTATGCESVSGTTDTQEPQKMLIDGHLYIVLPDGTTYSATGEKIQ